MKKITGMMTGGLLGLAFAGCAGTDQAGTADEQINTTPASLTEGAAELEKLDHLMQTSGSSDALVEQERLIRAQMDRLGGLVDQIDIAPDHSLHFFVTSDGTTLVGERMHVGTPSAVQGLASPSIDSIYARFAPGREIPAALAGRVLDGASDAADVPFSTSGGAAFSPPAPAAGNGTEVVTSALTNSASDNTWFRNNDCPSGNVAQWCDVSWTGGRTASSVSDHSETFAAFTSGAGSILLNFAPSGGAITWNTSILPGEVQFWWAVGPHHSVKNSGCIPLVACQTHYEAQRIQMVWSITSASGKVFDFSGAYYNKPLAWNSL